MFYSRSFRWAWVITVIFAVIFGLISLVNHYFFRTAALDLGMFNHAIFNFSRFESNEFMLTPYPSGANYLGDHFSPITMLFAPLRYLFGTYTLLIVQIGAILFGAWGIKKYSDQYTSKPLLGVLFMLQFLLVFGIYNALYFDFHNNVIAAMLVPWLLLYYRKGKMNGFLLFYALILITKENMALWLVFILLGAVFQNWTKRKSKVLTFELPLLIFTVFYFLIIMGWVMPYLRNGVGSSFDIRYGYLGDGVFDMMMNLVMHPSVFFDALWENTLNDSFFDGIKEEFHFMIWVSGGIFLIYRPVFLFMLIPIYAQKFLVNDAAFWGINNHYSIEFVPIITLAAIHGITALFSYKVRWQVLMIVILIISTGFFNYQSIEERKSLWYSKNRLAFYDEEHYKEPFNVKHVYKALELIPDQAIVSVSPSLAPHLAFRSKIYHFPVVEDAEYIILFKTHIRGPYPLSDQLFNEKIKYFKTQSYAMLETEELIILKK